jgi:MFS family permease
MSPGGSVALGLRANAPQFALLVIVNAFVGTMVGVERSVLPLLAEREFGLAAGAAALAYIGAFGLSKAGLNLVAGPLAERWGRKRVLIVGWLVGLPVPLLLMWAPTWGWVVFANLLLGVNQALAWSMTVNMKIDLVGPTRRGLALGLNECAGYLAVGLAAFGAAVLADMHGLRPWPFALALAAAVLGLAASVVLVRDTRAHVALEVDSSEKALAFGRVFARTSWQDRSLFAASQAGLVNNLNDAVIWGLLPLVWAAQGLNLPSIGLLAASYPVVWSLGQLVTGPLSDRLGRKPLVVAGMLVQAGGIWVALLGLAFSAKVAGVALLGVGTAMVYPTLLATVSDLAEPAWRASAVGVYRFWRDAGFLAGALGAGLLAEAATPHLAVQAVAVLTLASGLLALGVMRETLPAIVGSRFDCSRSTATLEARLP